MLRVRTSRSSPARPTSARARSGSRSSSSTGRAESSRGRRRRSGSPRSLKAKPFAQTTARPSRSGSNGNEPGEPQDGVRLDTSSSTSPASTGCSPSRSGARRSRRSATSSSSRRRRPRDVGAAAIPSKTPTLANATLKQLTTSTKPDPELYRTSVADALAAKKPFVVAFATPKYCTSRTCGPVVDVVDAVRRKHEDAGIRFIHAEIYEDNDPTKGENTWVREWKLPPSRGCSSSARTGRSRRASRARSPCASSTRPSHRAQVARARRSCRSSRRAR